MGNKYNKTGITEVPMWQLYMVYTYSDQTSKLLVFFVYLNHKFYLFDRLYFNFNKLQILKDTYN